MLLFGKIKLYLKLIRLNKPIGIWLLMWPTIWGFLLATDQKISWMILIKLIIGSLIMRSAGCIINDLIDHRIDQLVIRTKNRPLAAGLVSKFEAYLLLFILLSAGFILLLTFNKLTILIGLLTLLPIITYPYMKRITYWPQAFLGLTFNLGSLIGYSAVQNRLSIISILIYFSSVCWTIGYDTIYALQDKKFDKQLNIKSTALLFGDKIKAWLTMFYSLMIVLLLILGLIFKAATIFYLGLLLLILQLSWQILTLKTDDPQDCNNKFNSNNLVGWILSLIIIANKISS